MDSPPGSPLSSHASSEFADDVKTEERDQSFDALQDHDDTHLMPPSKRQRTGQHSYRSTPASHPEPPEDIGDISSDTSGDVPGSPLAPGMPQSQDEDPVTHEQVTVCRWLDCTVGDLGNMDVLVQHLHDVHIGVKQKRYACEWEGCIRIGMHHASGYALRAHMRSHTREKPFYCALPECDRSFTRSDALAKHMRTVHETEALRPSDPIPRSHSAAQVKPQRLKLIVNSRPPNDEQGNGDGDVDDDATIYSATDVDPDAPPPLPFEYPPDVHFTEEELSMPPDHLFKLLRRQVHWAEEDGSELRLEVEALQVKRKQEWQAKELVLANVMEAELATAVDKGEDHDKVMALKDDLPHPMLPLSGATPWYRIPQPEAAEESGVESETTRAVAT